MAQSRPSVFIISLLMQHVSHEYMLYVTFITSNIVLRHPILDVSKNVLILTVLEFDEIRRVSHISRDDSNGKIRFIIRDLEKFWVLTEITILPFFQKLKFSRVLHRECNLGQNFGDPQCTLKCRAQTYGAL